MANTYELIASSVLSATATTVTFSSIPQTYTDLVLKTTVRSEYASAQSRYRVYVNTLSTRSIYNYSALVASGATVGSESAVGNAFWYSQESPAATSTSNTFDSNEWYFADYTATTFNKNGVNYESSISTNLYQYLGGSNLNDPAAITTLYVVMGNSANFSIGSTFYLYGIKKS